MEDRQAIPLAYAAGASRRPLVDREVTLEEMLADPIIVARMNADGVGLELVRHVIQQARRSLTLKAA